MQTCFTAMRAMSVQCLLRNKIFFRYDLGCGKNDNVIEEWHMPLESFVQTKKTRVSNIRVNTVSTNPTRLLFRTKA